jgi:hypothetical protein
MVYSKVMQLLRYLLLATFALTVSGCSHWHDALAQAEADRIFQREKAIIDLEGDPSFCITHVRISRPTCHPQSRNKASCTYIRQEIVRLGACLQSAPENASAHLLFNGEEWRFSN